MFYEYIASPVDTLVHVREKEKKTKGLFIIVRILKPLLIQCPFIAGLFIQPKNSFMT